MFMATKQIFKKFINLASMSNKDTHPWGPQGGKRAFLPPGN